MSAIAKSPQALPQECWTCGWHKFVSRKGPGSWAFCANIDSELWGHLEWDRSEPHTCDHWKARNVQG